MSTEIMTKKKDKKKEKKAVESGASDCEVDSGKINKSEKKKEKKDKKREGEGEEDDSEKESKKQKKVKVEGQVNSSTNTSTFGAADGPKFKVAVTGMDGLKVVETFASTKFHPQLACLTSKFTTPTPIQAYSWPVLERGRDMIGIAETGSGKTLAFSLPILSKILASKSQGVKMLVVAPTRELAMQTFDVVNKAIPESICLYGGSSRGEQIRLIKSKKPTVVIGTPGRLVDFINDGVLDLSKLEFFVLDEADRMLDLGFEPDIKVIVDAIPKDRQTIMFSATWPYSIQKMAAKYLREPVKITVKAVDGDEEETGVDGENVEGGESSGSADIRKASNRVHQIVQVVKDPWARDPILLDLLKKYHSSKKNRILIFALYKKECDRIERLLQSRGWSCVSIHGDKPQRERTEALASFKSGQVPLMIATDVAARGLDIPDVEYVINFTFPLTIEDYIHRIGRTGRGGAFGTAHTLFTDNDKPHSGELINVLKASTNSAEIPKELMAYGTTVKKKVHKEYGSHFKEIDPNAKACHVKFDSDEE